MAMSVESNYDISSRKIVGSLGVVMQLKLSPTNATSVGGQVS